MVIITGASQGIGRFLFTRFKSEGNNVTGTYNFSANEIECDKTLYHKVDISDFKQVESWIEAIKPSLEDIILINCAGMSYTSFAHKSDPALWKKVIDVNLTGTYNVIRCLLPEMRERNYGRIVNFSSVVTKVPTPGVSAYAASKAALVGMTKTLAVENGRCGITVNSINLGYVDLGMGIHSVTDEYRKFIEQRNPLSRFCDPEEVYKTVKFLIETEYVNGTNIEIDGGL